MQIWTAINRKRKENSSNTRIQFGHGIIVHIIGKMIDVIKALPSVLSKQNLTPIQCPPQKNGSNSWCKRQVQCADVKMTS